MTLPTSGAITIGQVATELGASLPLSLGDSRVLQLAGKSGAPISLSDLYGKSALSITGFSTAAGANSNTVTVSATVRGGSGAVTYAWSADGDLRVSGSTSGTSVTIIGASTQKNTVNTGIVYLTVTSGGNSASSSVAANTTGNSGGGGSTQ